MNEKIVLSDSQLNDLSSSLANIVTKFYEDTKNEEEFQKWLLSVEKQEL